MIKDFEESNKEIEKAAQEWDESATAPGYSSWYISFIAGAKWMRAQILEESLITNNNKSWKDEKTGLTWGPKLEGEYTFEQAQKAPPKGWRLPTIEEFKIAEKNGFREHFDDFKNKFFWSSSVFDNDVAWEFCGDSGHSVYYFRDFQDSVRCVR